MVDLKYIYLCKKVLLGQFSFSKQKYSTLDIISKFSFNSDVNIQYFMHLLPKLSLHNLVLVSFMPKIYGNIYCENSRLKLVIHNPHYDTMRKQEQGHIYQTAISHHSNKSMAILGVHLVMGEPLRIFLFK